MNSRERAEKLLSGSGITLNGDSPWDVQVHDERLYDRIFAGGSLALGESYMDGWWDAKDIAEFFSRMMRNVPLSLLGVGIAGQVVKSKLLNLQSSKRAFQVAERHYDLGNDLYEKMLDRNMAYSCGYWKDAKTLDEAQIAKFDLICRKLRLKKHETVLDIGCGWGGLAIHAAEKYGAQVVGLTVSKEQAELARKRAKGLSVDIRFQDWRDLGDKKFNHVMSVGMFEHVGPKNYRPFMEKVRSVLADDGLFLLHTIGHSKTTRNIEPWFHKYIFPNGHLPAAAQITKATDRKWFGPPVFVVEDWHNFGADYDKTLLAWFENFDNAWPELKGRYDERFYRMWKYFCLSRRECSAPVIFICGR